MQPTELKLADFVDGLGFPEAPRWHEEALWVSDIVKNSVLRLDSRGHASVVVHTHDEPSGLGWLPDGQLLVVQMETHEIWRWNGMKLHRYSGTSSMTRARLNDMVVDAKGRAWVSSLGFDYEREKPVPTNLVCVDPGGRAWIAASDLWCPNGMAISPDGAQLVVGQSARPDVVTFRIGEDGRLDKRALFGTLPGNAVSDGLCMDAAGALWIASPTTHEFLRMEPGGRITHRIGTGERFAIACVLGGRERRTLYCVTTATQSLRAARHDPGMGRIGTVAVEVPGAGTP